MGYSIHSMLITRGTDMSVSKVVGERGGPLRSADMRGGPPRRFSSFVGRAAESAHLDQLLRDHPLVTITGPGGSGKSRLAMHVVAGVDGEVWWVELVDLNDVELLPARVAQVTGVQPLPGTDVRSQLDAQFASRPTLLLLDNCEHLAAGVADLVHDLLSRGTRLRVLATSRRPLGVDGEVVWSIPSLSLPSEVHGVTEADLQSSASARLFLDRARAARPGIRVDDEAAGHVAHLCRHLDGMPLALELAAARVRSFEIGRIRAELDRALDLLSGAGSPRVSRHRTMQASIAWSEGLLTPDERVVLRRVAVFSGGFCLEDALPVVIGMDLSRGRTIEALDGLVNQSMLMFDEGYVGPPRYRLQEVIRQHASHRLRQAGEDEALRRRHAEQYLVRAAELGTRLARAWNDEAFAWLAADLNNLDASLRFLCDRSEPDRAAELLWHTQNVWGLAGPVMATGLVQHLLTHRTSLNVLSLARVHVATAVIQADAGALAAAFDAATSALPLAQQTDDAVLAARARVYFEAIRSSADPIGVESALRAAVEHCQAVGDTVGALFGRFWLAACVTVFQGGTARALLLVGENLDDDATSSHPVHAAGAHALMAEAMQERCEIDIALRHACTAEERLEHVAQLLGSGADRFRAMSIAGSVAALVRGYTSILRNQPPLSGIDLVAASIRSAADGHGVAAYLYRFLSGLEHLRRDEFASALVDLEAAIPLSAAIGGWFHANTRIVAALAALSTADPFTAGDWLAEIDEAGLIAPLLRAKYRVVQADLALLRDAPQEAESLAHLEFEATVDVRAIIEVAMLVEVLSRAAVSQGDPRQGVILGAIATRLRMDKGLTLGPPGHILPFQHDLERARTAMGTQEFEDAWRQGVTLSLDESVAFVRRARGQRRRPAFGWNSLTPTELQVAELVARGLTNPQIGLRLLISRETVKTHLRHIFIKIDVHSRAQLAALVQRHSQADVELPVLE